MDWLKKQITLAQQGIAANTGGDNSSVESDEGSPLHNKGILIMYCHVVKDDVKVQKNLHLDFYTGQIFFTKGNKFVKSFTCSDIINIGIQNEVLTIDYKKKYQITNRQKRLQFSSNFEALQIRNHLKFIGENGILLRKLFLLIDREHIDSVTVVDLMFVYRMHDIAITEDQCKNICEKMADPKEIITTHLVDSDDCFDFIQFFHAFYVIWIAHEELYAPRSFRECLLNWMHYSAYSSIPVTRSSDSEDKGISEASTADDELANISSTLVISSLILMSGESIHKSYKCVRWCVGCKPKTALSFFGSMIITDFRLVFEIGDSLTAAEHSHSRFRVPPYFNRLEIPLHSIHRIQTDVSSGSIILNVKDTRMVHVTVSTKHRRQVLEEATLLINRHAFPGSMRQLKLFGFRNPEIGVRSCGWEMSDLRQEYHRMGLDECTSWRVFDNSANWKLCDSYPPFIVVPSQLKSIALHAVAEHRSRGRLPVVTYRHKANGAVLVRSSQPLVGITKKTSSEDGFIMECFRLREKTFDAKGAYLGPKLFILDLRRQIAAAVNMVAGKGTEDTAEYTNTELIFCNIDNIHVMRASLNNLADATCTGAEMDLNFNAKVEESGWLKHLSLLLAASVLAAEKIHLEEATVLNHCSDGFDRTSQTCALTQILLDPYYRTIEGLACLIEKDWCAFGFKFKDRHGHGIDFNISADERSPIFIQFLDAVHQILIQFPSAFEFNSLLLVFIADNSLSGLFGNFIGNSYKQRHVELRAQECTQSIWSVVFERRDLFTNTSFSPYESPLWPSTSLKKIRLWDRYFLRWDPSCHPSGLSEEQWFDHWDDLSSLRMSS